MAIETRRHYTLRLRSRTLELGARTLVMGVLNVTPDSFSDAGRFYGFELAIEQAHRFIEEGADIIDIGGESTRPFSEPVSLDEELTRVMPVIRHIRESSDIPVSIDTTKAEVARQALAAGAEIINDVSALRFDPQMVTVAAQSGAPLILMHMLGTPKTMQESPTYAALFSEIITFLEERLDFAVSRGVERRQVIVDPGIGFGKTVTHNLQLIRNLEYLKALDRPVLLGASRKRFIGSVLDRDVHEREIGTAVANAFGIAAGAHLIRVHEVAIHKQAAVMSDAIRNAVQGDTD